MLGKGKNDLFYPLNSSLKKVMNEAGLGVYGDLAPKP